MMRFGEVVQSIATTARAQYAQEAIRAVYGRHASRWLAEQAGISPRTARRWLSGSYPRGRASRIVEAARDAAGPRGVAAQRLARASAIDVGTVEVEYDGISQGWRDIGVVNIGKDGFGYVATCCADLQEGNTEAAAEAFSNAVISGYEIGLEDTLSVSDYSDGVQLDN